VRTFDDLIRAALVDIAKQAAPVDLVDAALNDIHRRNRFLMLGAVATATLTLGAGLVVGLTTGQDTPQGRFQPNGVAPGQPGTNPQGDCDTARPGCASPEANTTLAASESPSPNASPSRSASKRPTPTATSATTAGTDGGPGNRPRPKPSRPGKAG
jgi:hypothetical protein